MSLRMRRDGSKAWGEEGLVFDGRRTLHSQRKGSHHTVWTLR